LGPSAFEQFRFLFYMNGGTEGAGPKFWRWPEQDTLRARITAFRGRYSLCARQCGLEPTRLVVLAAAGAIVPITIYLILGTIGLSSLRAETVLLAFAFTPAGWLLRLLLDAACCMGIALLATSSVAVDAATADVLEQLAATPVIPANPVVAVADELTHAYDNVPTGWS